MADKPESAGRRNLYRALLAALFSSPIVVSLVVKYFDPVALYKAYNAPLPPPPPPKLTPAIVVTAQWKPFLGMMRRYVWQSPTKYTLAEMDFQIKNNGDLASQNLFLQMDFSDDITIQRVTGDTGAEDMHFKDMDGNFKPIDQANDWPEDDHYVVIHIARLEAGLGGQGQVFFYFETGHAPKQPKLTCWDDTPAKYQFNWPTMTGN
jgi:hypothetical protein